MKIQHAPAFTTALLTATAIPVFLTDGAAHAANTAPFTETFSDPVDGFDFDVFTPEPDNAYTFTPNTVDGTLDVSLTSGATAYTFVEVDGVPSTVNTQVRVSTDFTLTDGNTATTRIGFVLFGQEPVIKTNGNPEAYVAFISEPGGFGAAPEFDVFENNQFIFGTASPFTNITDALDQSSYNLEVVATILVDEILFDFTLTDLNNPSLVESGSILYTDVPGPPTGEFFGLAIDRNNAGPASSIVFDNFSVSSSVIPEPASALLFAAGLGLLVRRRPNRRA